ncbi:MAG: hypothetical protein AAF458_18240 [Pseudomonadota bacterium]
MQINEIDLELLEVLTLQVPWYMICGEFADRYGGPGPLARRLLELQAAEYIRIRDTGRPDHQITVAELEADALANNCYEDLDDTREPQWDMMATEQGYALVKQRFEIQ